MRSACRGVALLLALVAAVPARGAAQSGGGIAAPREEVRTEISARVGAIRSLKVEDAGDAAAGAHVSRVEVASNVPCLLVVRAPQGDAVRVSVDGGALAVLQPGARLVLGQVRPGVHRLRVAVDAGRAAQAPALSYALEDLAEEAPAVPAAAAGAAGD